MSRFEVDSWRPRPLDGHGLVVTPDTGLEELRLLIGFACAAPDAVGTDHGRKRVAEVLTAAFDHFFAG